MFVIIDKDVISRIAYDELFIKKFKPDLIFKFIFTFFAMEGFMKAIYLTLKTLLIFSVLLTGCRDIFGDREQPELIVQAPIEGNSINVYEPVWGTVYQPGDTILIKWLAPRIDRLDISLYRKSEFKFTIHTNVENKSKINWIVPSGIPPSNHYRIKISNHNNADTYNFSKQFGIYN